MRYLITLIVTSSVTLSNLIGCTQSATNTSNNGDLRIVTLAATPTDVPAGATSLIICKVTGGDGKYVYTWDASGAYGYLGPRDSICVFSSPSCHSGPATVTVMVVDGNGSRASSSVDLN